MANQNHTIKDIASLAGVSAGTVDRVLHNRGDVSEKSRQKVQKVLDEINYKPNVFAIGLAAKKRYTIVCVLPCFVENDYWHSVVQGVERAIDELNPFNVEVKFLNYRHGDRDSYQEVCSGLKSEAADAVMIAPNFEEETLDMTQSLKARGVPYAFIDFNIEEADAMKYIGQDSHRSGYIAAQILVRTYNKEEDEIALFLSNRRDSPAEIQMRRRMEGFMQYFADHRIEVKSYEVILTNDDADKNNLILEAFFSSHPKVMLGVVFNSRIYQVGHYLQRSQVQMKGLVGYDLLLKNVELLKAGVISHLIGQRPGLQGYLGVKALTDCIIFKKPRNKMKYMPIDILIKENIDFYFEFE